MVETAPLPAGFPAALDAGTLPTVEAEAIPAPGSLADHEPIRRPLPQSGYLTASPAALRNLAEGEERIRRMIGPGIKHASTIAAEQAEREAEIERKARDPRAVWRMSLTLESEALAEVDRLAPLIERARALVRSLESRQRDNAATVAAGDEAAAEALIEALAAGAETSVSAPQVDVAEAEAIAAELRPARAALAQLERQARAAARSPRPLPACEPGAYEIDPAELARVFPVPGTLLGTM